MLYTLCKYTNINTQPYTDCVHVCLPPSVSPWDLFPFIRLPHEFTHVSRACTRFPSQPMIAIFPMQWLQMFSFLCPLRSWKAHDHL